MVIIVEVDKILHFALFLRFLYAWRLLKYVVKQIITSGKVVDGME